MSNHKKETMRLSEQGVVTGEALLAYLRDELSTDEKQEIEKLLPSAEFEALENYCLKATTDEMIDRALELASVHARRK